jgi:hypothetical protein
MIPNTHESRGYFTVVAVCILRIEVIVVVDFSGSVGRYLEWSERLDDR